jgi:hypothetical protein
MAAIRTHIRFRIYSVPNSRPWFGKREVARYRIFRQNISLLKQCVRDFRQNISRGRFVGAVRVETVRERLSLEHFIIETVRERLHGRG